MNLSGFSIDRRITVLVLFLTTLVVGGIATLRIEEELFPSGFTEPFLRVSVPWSNAPSRDVLQKVVLPLEEEISTVRGLSNQASVSTVGSGAVYMWFKQGTDMDVAYREVRDRVERARTRFPAEVDRVFIRKDDTSGFPVQMIGVAVDPAQIGSYDLVKNVLARRLERVDGVASVSIEGIREKEILIELDREKTAAAGLNIFELSQELGGDNFTMASGTVREGQRKLLLRSVARFESLEALEDRLVAPETRLRDVATIRYEEPEKDFRVRAMSRPAVALKVMKEGDANVKKVCAALDVEIEKISRDPRFAGLWLKPLFSQGDVIDEALGTLLGSGAIGGVLALFVLLFFLRRLRLTVILALAIPLSILIGLTVMYFAGESLNLLTLLGLMICVGLLVDNSVVVAENIHRLYREGAARRDACVRGAGEVSLAITMSTLTTIVVFAPVALVEGPAQFFLLRLALPVCVSVGASLIVALVFIPISVYLTLDDRKRTDGTIARAHARLVDLGRLAYDQTMGRINAFYTRVLGYFLARRFDLVILILAVFVITAAVPGSRVEFVPGQEEESAGFQVSVQMPRGWTLEETERWFLDAEALVESKKEELDLEGWFHFHEKEGGEIQGWFNRPRRNKISPTEATRIVKEALPLKPGMELHIAGDEEGASGKRSQAFYSIVLNGEDPDQLDQVKHELEEVFVAVEGVLGLTGGNDLPPSELGLVVNRERTTRLGVNPQHVAGVVSTALMGMQLPKYRDGGREVPVRIRYEEADRESLTELSDFTVPTSNGGTLPISAVTDAEFLPDPATMIRRNKRMGRFITLQLEEGTEEQTRLRLDRLQANIDLPEGVSFGADRAVLTFDDDLENLRYALLISIVLIYLLMGFLFESFVLPLSIVLTIPLSIIGVYWAHLIAGKDIDFLGMVAMVLLVGVVVNNGIVLIDYVNRLRHAGWARDKAMLRATELRFRPIMMTAITTIGGLIPLAFAGANSIGLSYNSFATTLIGGMTTATLLTLLVVPVFYALFDDMRAACASALAAALGRARPGSDVKPSAAAAQGEPSSA